MYRIGFDAKRYFFNSTGLGNYSRTLIHALCQYFPENEYQLFSPKIPKNHTSPSYPQLNYHQPSIPFFRSIWRRKWMTQDLIKQNIQLYHGLSHELPLGIEKTPIPSVVTIHDLIFLRYPEYYKKADIKIYELKFKHACVVADQIIAVSEQTKRDLIEFFQIPAEKIKVIYQTCDTRFQIKLSQEELQKTQQKYQLPTRFILNVGTIEARKNLLLLVQALSHLSPEIPLVVVGKATSYKKEVLRYIHQHAISNPILFLENVDSADLPAIYQLADLFVYPSKFEGFGIPILEALNSGIPVLAAKGSCLEEAGGPSSIYIHPEIAIDLSEQISFLWNNEEKKELMVKKGKEHALQFSTERMAKEVMALYQSLLK